MITGSSSSNSHERGPDSITAALDLLLEEIERARLCEPYRVRRIQRREPWQGGSVIGAVEGPDGILRQGGCAT